MINKVMVFVYSQQRIGFRQTIGRPGFVFWFLLLLLASFVLPLSTAAYAGNSTSNIMYINYYTITSYIYADSCEGITIYLDADGDGFGDVNESYFAADCILPEGYALDSTDCDDTNPMVHPMDDAGGITQYASRVLDFSTEYSTDAWAAAQALGEPNVYPAYCDCAEAWSSLTPEDIREFLVLGFATPSRINAIDIYETLAPGAIDTVFVKNPETYSWDMVYTNTAATGPEVATILHITFPLTDYAVSEIRIAINSPAVPGWNEIDAVSIYAPDFGEICNGIDDNCNGETDEGFTAASIIIYPEGPSTACGDDFVGLAALYTGSSLQWKKDGVDVPGAVDDIFLAYSNGSYTCAASNECGSALSDAVYVTINDSPIADISATGSTTICIGDSLSLNAAFTPNCTYQWFKDDITIAGATDINFMATDSGTYSCLVTDTMTNCATVSNLIEVFVSCPDGLVDLQTAFQIYPNPAYDILTIETGFSGEKTVYISDALGQVVKTMLSSNHILTIDLKNLASGMYWMKLEVGVHSVTEEFMKQ
jgi:hypothetical protein